MWKYLIASLLILSCSSIANPGQKDCPETGKKPGEYSQLSVELCFQDWNKGRRHLRVESPDHSLQLVVDGNNGLLYKQGRAMATTFVVTPDEEWIWSPDSRAVIVTTHLGNAGPESAGVTFVDGLPTVPDDLAETIQKDFALRHVKSPCGSEPNVAGLTWLDGSKEAVLVAEIPASPHCEKADGYFEAYVVSIPKGRILRRYSMVETVKKFGSILGPRLLGDVEEQKDERKGR
jgi:hypothetical protein